MKTNKEKFELFHATNPHVYTNLVTMARRYRAQEKRTKIGIATLWESLRWNYLVGTEHRDFKLNNDFKAHYARLIMSRNADLRDMFNVRELSAA